MLDCNQQITDFIRRLYGNTKAPIPLHEPVFAGKEKAYMADCIDSTFVSSIGKYVDRFEESIAAYAGVPRAVACSNGTSALHMALMLAGVSRNTEVITQALSFIATSNAIVYCEGIPVYLDVDLDTMGLSPASLETWLAENVEMNISRAEHGDAKPVNKKTGRIISACLPVHIFGHPCRIEEIVLLCAQYNIPVIEDAAESLGSFYKSRHTGTFGRIGVLSFNGNKIITTGGGGMMLFRDSQLADRAKHLTTQAKVAHPWELAHDEIGYNYRMPNINAALGLAQYESLPGFLEIKKGIAASYKKFFRDLNAESCQDFHVRYMPDPPDSEPNHWLNTVLFSSRETRDHFLSFSNSRGVITRPAWNLMTRLVMYKHCQTGPLPNTKELGEGLVNLPSGVMHTKDAAESR